MTADLVVNDLLEGALLMVGLVINNAIWDMMQQTGLSTVPFLALIASEWFRTRQEGDDEGNKGLLTINRIETKLYAMILVYIFTCLPVFSANTQVASVDEQRADQCGVALSSGDWSERETVRSVLDGQAAAAPLWWSFVHSISKGVTNAAVAAIPCSTGYHAIRTAVDTSGIADPALAQEVGRFQRICYGAAINALFRDQPVVSENRAHDVDWIGSRYLRENYYSRFYAQRPVAGFEFDANGRDIGRMSNSDGWGYPSCLEWWSAPDIGLQARLRAQVAPTVWDRVQDVLGGSDAEDAVIRRMISSETGNNVQFQQGINLGLSGYGDLTPGADLFSEAGAQVGGLMGWFPFEAAMVMVKAALPAVLAVLEMAAFLALPIIAVMSGYSFGAMGTVTFALFALYFLRFWFELARWLDDRMIDFLYPSQLERFTWFSGDANAFDELVLQFLTGSLFIVLPGIWFTIAAWSGAKVGGGLAGAMQGSTQKAQNAGEKGAQQVQSNAAGGKK